MLGPLRGRKHASTTRGTSRVWLTSGYGNLIRIVVNNLRRLLHFDFFVKIESFIGCLKKSNIMFVEV